MAWVVVVSSPDSISASITSAQERVPIFAVEGSSQLGYAAAGIRSANGISWPSSTGPSWSGTADSCVAAPAKEGERSR
jgi:hypothetical protein